MWWSLFFIFLFFPPAPYKAPEDNCLKAYGVPGRTCTGEESPCLRAAVIGEYPRAWPKIRTLHPPCTSLSSATANFSCLPLNTSLWFSFAWGWCDVLLPNSPFFYLFFWGVTVPICLVAKGCWFFFSFSWKERYEINTASNTCGCQFYRASSFTGVWVKPCYVSCTIKFNAC